MLVNVDALFLGNLLGRGVDLLLRDGPPGDQLEVVPATLDEGAHEAGVVANQPTSSLSGRELPKTTLMLSQPGSSASP